MGQVISIGTADFTIDVDPLPESDLRARALELFEAWDERIARDLRLPDYGLRLELEEGSIKGKAKVWAAFGALAVVVGFASDVTSLIRAVKDFAASSRSVNAELIKDARRTLASEGGLVQSRKTAGRVGQLESIFVRVQSRAISPEEGAAQARKLFEAEPDATHEDLERIQRAVKAVPRFPEQLAMFQDEFAVSAAAPADPKKPSKKPPKSEQPLAGGFRVEIVRDSKTGQPRISSRALKKGKPKRRKKKRSRRKTKGD